MHSLSMGRSYMHNTMCAVNGTAVAAASATVILQCSNGVVKPTVIFICHWRFIWTVGL